MFLLEVNVKKIIEKDERLLMRKTRTEREFEGKRLRIKIKNSTNYFFKETHLIVVTHS